MPTRRWEWNSAPRCRPRPVPIATTLKSSDFPCVIDARKSLVTGVEKDHIAVADTYSRVMPEMQREASAAFDDPVPDRELTQPEPHAEERARLSRPIAM